MVIIEVTDSQLAIYEEICLDAMLQIDINENVYREELSDHDIVSDVKVFIKNIVHYCFYMLINTFNGMKWIRCPIIQKRLLYWRKNCLDV